MKTLLIAMLTAATIISPNMVNESDNSLQPKDGEVIEHLQEMGWDEVHEISYDEMIREIAQRTGKSIDQVKIEIPDENENSRSANSYVYIDAYKVQNVSVVYKPRVHFYIKCTTNSSGIANEMHEVLLYELDTGNTLTNVSHPSKQFVGTLFVNLESTKSLYYNLNGDFYNNGSVEWNVGGTLKVGDSFTLTAQKTSVNNHYLQYHFNERLTMN